MEVIYLIRAIGTDRYKIGYTANPPIRRMKQLETASPYPLEIVATMEGRLFDEKKLQLYLENHCVHKEWFELAEPTLSIVLDIFEGKARIASWFRLQDPETRA